MDRDIIILHEEENDGKTIYLYYDKVVGVYLAFGQSAYYTTMVTEPYLSYSDELNLPVALLERQHILYLRQSLKKVEHEQKKFYEFKIKNQIGKAGYGRWSQKIYDNHNRING